MNILLISYYFFPCSAVGAKRWSNFYKISNNDKEVNFTVLTANWKGKKIYNKNIHYLGKSIRYNPTNSITRKYNFVDFLKHPTLGIRSIDKSLLSSWYKETKNWLDKNANKKYDVVISSFGPVASILLGDKAKNIFKVPFILDLRDLISIQGQKKKIFILNFLDNQIDKYFTRNVDLFLTVSSTSKNKSKKFYKKKVVTIYNSMEDELKKNIKLNFNNKNNELNILYMGTMGITRNPSNILDIFNNYSKNNKKLMISFKFASKDNPFDFIKKKKPYIKIKWLGYLNKKKLEIEKRQCNIFLLLEDQNENGNENITGKIFEYMNESKPIIASCNKNSDINKIIKFSNTGMIINDQNDLLKFFKSNFLVKKNNINFYSQKNQYKLLKKTLKRFYY